MANKGLIMLGILAMAGIAGMGAWQFYFKDKLSLGQESGDVAYVTKLSDLTEESMGVVNWYAGVVEPQSTVKVNIDSGRKVKEVEVSVGQNVKPGDLLFEYDLSSIEDDLKQAQLDYDRLVNEAMSLAENLTQLEKEKKKAKANVQLSYTIEIETNKMNQKKNEYDQVSAKEKIEKLQAATGNTEVRSTVEGVIQKIDTSKLSDDDGDSLSDSMTSYYTSDDSDNSFITILGTGNYRIKGQVNEQNRQDIVMGDAVIIRSRADENRIWHGTMGMIDEQNGTSSSSDSFWGMSDSSDSQTNSTTYPFYVEMEDSQGLMLGQHVYIERDEGQSDRAGGLWIGDYYILGVDTDSPYVWAAGPDGRLEKRSIVLGEYNEELGEYLVLEGLALTDSIAYPDDYLEEGMRTADSSTMPVEEEYDGEDDEEGYDEDDDDDTDWEEDDSDWEDEDTDWEDLDLEEASEDDDMLSWDASPIFFDNETDMEVEDEDAQEGNANTSESTGEITFDFGDEMIIDDWALDASDDMVPIEGGFTSEGFGGGQVIYGSSDVDKAG